MNKQFNPFVRVSARYGAPMGRTGCAPANIQDARRLHARRQGGGDGYDRGGAYWGYPSNVYGVWAWVDGDACCTYVRAASRAAAIALVRSGGDASGLDKPEIAEIVAVLNREQLRIRG